MRIKQLTNNKELWDALNEELDTLIEVERLRLEQYTDPVEMYISQGKIKGYRRLKQLRDDVNGRRD